MRILLLAVDLGYLSLRHWLSGTIYRGLSCMCSLGTKCAYCVLVQIKSVTMCSAPTTGCDTMCRDTDVHDIGKRYVPWVDFCE